MHGKHVFKDKKDFTSQGLDKRRKALRKQEFFSQIKKNAGYREVPRVRATNIFERKFSQQPKKNLFDAYYAGDTASLQFLITEGANVNSATKKGYTILMLAAECGNVEILKLLLASPEIQVNKQDDWNYTALIRAAKLGRFESVQLLLGATNIHVDVNAFDTFGKTALIYAAEKGHYFIVVALLNAGACNVNFCLKGGDNATKAAFKNGHHNVVSLLESHRVVLPTILKQQTDLVAETETTPSFPLVPYRGCDPVVFSTTESVVDDMGLSQELSRLNFGPQGSPVGISEVDIVEAVTKQLSHFKLRSLIRRRV